MSSNAIESESYRILNSRVDLFAAKVNGLPVGAAEFKAMLGESGLPGPSKVSDKGGSAVAAAALKTLLYTVKDKEITG